MVLVPRFTCRQHVQISIKILSKKHEGLTSLVIDLEDAVDDNEVEKAEELLVQELLKLYGELSKEYLTIDDLPLMFIRIRNLEQLNG